MFGELDSLTTRSTRIGVEGDNDAWKIDGENSLPREIREAIKPFIGWAAGASVGERLEHRHRELCWRIEVLPREDGERYFHLEWEQVHSKLQEGDARRKQEIQPSA